MAFAVICKSCQARFLLNDDLLRRKVAGRVVTVRCRQCHAPIEVDASAVDAPQAASAKPEPPGPPPPPPLKAALNYKPAPSPPRPTKSSTLMGIGLPARPGSAPEMVALSPGLLHMPSPAPAGPHGFPEPPPPPSADVESISGDWEIPEVKTPLMAPVEAPPESLDDFVEELPPSLPPSKDTEEEPPTSIGTPSLAALTHHDQAARPRGDDFFSNMSAALNGGTAPSGAPTIDVSTLASGQAEAGPSIDISSFDAPLTGKQTLPLFGMDEDQGGPKLAPLTVDQLTAPPKPRQGSLSPSSIDQPSPSQRPESSRGRRNVVAPATTSEPPPAAKERRSIVAVPVLLVLAAAAGFLIWKRGAPSATDDKVAAVTEQTAAVPAPPPPAPVAPPAADTAAVAAATTT